MSSLKKGMTLLINFSIGTSVIEQVVNITVPNGGVMVPIAPLKINTIPK